MYTKLFTSTFTAIALSATMAAAAPINLTTWSAEGAGNWNIQSGNDSVVQTQNGDPTVFHNNSSSSQGNDLQGEITVTGTDDDFIGFVLGYNTGDLTNDNADYLLIDWKQGDQNFFGGLATEGLAISRVTGSLQNGLGPWVHDPANNVTELDRATNLGGTGWDRNVTYDFKIDFTATNVKVFVNDVLEIDIDGIFADGGFGFYNYSQANVEYAGITSNVIVDPNVVPLPAAAWMLLAGIGGLAAMGRRKQS